MQLAVSVARRRLCTASLQHLRVCNHLTHDSALLSWTGSTSCRAHRPLLGTARYSTGTQHQVATPDSTEIKHIEPAQLERLHQLPLYCPGCGAPSQITAAEEAGYFTLTRQGLRKYFHNVLVSPDESEDSTPVDESRVLCDRCHNLLHHSQGVPIYHPSIQSIHDIINESPYKYNHIYHILDAADLPMSLIPSLQNDLRLPRLRSQNRRSKHMQYSHGRVAEVSFIIARADLLAPKKEMVDSLMPYLRELLRDALRRTRKNVRMGMLKCVSAQRGWWTTTVKEDIWRRGGAGWMVGKVNVGKSSLFQVVFPKGRSLLKSESNQEEAEEAGDALSIMDVAGEEDGSGGLDRQDDSPLLPFSEASTLLPPARSETMYPVMPIASALPGTTASPIRVPFGSGKGELIDLPGVARSTLETYVIPSERDSLVMHKRVAATQHVIKAGQSMLLGGGLIRLTPSDPDLVVLAYPFLPLDVHITSTAKAEAIEAGTRAPPPKSIVAGETFSRVKRATTASLQWDVTRQRAGPLTDKAVGKRKAESLPFVVWSADVVVEGVGWVELIAQTRRRARVREQGSSLREEQSDGHRDDPFADSETPGEQCDHEQRKPDEVTRGLPAVEIFSPEGRFVAVRRPMGAAMLNAKPGKKKGRPRKSTV